jgi:hypothetical protein
MVIHNFKSSEHNNVDLAGIVGDCAILARLTHEPLFRKNIKGHFSICVTA